jgi:putative endonuclease
MPFNVTEATTSIYAVRNRSNLARTTTRDERRRYAHGSKVAHTLDHQLIMFYMYILRSAVDNQLYIGSTNNLRRRLVEHNAGDVSSTKPRRPLTLIYYEAYQNESDARKREHQLKLRGRALAQLKRRIEGSLQQTDD